MAKSKKGDLEQFLSAYFGAERISPEAILRTAISVLPDILVPRAAALSYKIVDYFARERLQCGLRLRLGDADQAVRVVKGLRAIGASEVPDKVKALQFVDLASCLPEPLPGFLVDEAQAFVEHLRDDVVRTQALVVLTPHLPESMKDSALAKIYQISSLPDYPVAIENLTDEGYAELAVPPGSSKFEVDLHGVIETLSAEDQTALFTKALDIAEAGLSAVPPVNEPEAPLPNASFGKLRLANVRRSAVVTVGEQEASFTEGISAPQERVVNTGFAATRLPGGGFDPSTPLIPDLEYLYWVEIGKQMSTSIEIKPTALPLCSCQSRKACAAKTVQTAFGVPRGAKKARDCQSKL